jgi:hypothetical protein
MHVSFPRGDQWRRTLAAAPLRLCQPSGRPRDLSCLRSPSVRLAACMCMRQGQPSPGPHRLPSPLWRHAPLIGMRAACMQLPARHATCRMPTWHAAPGPTAPALAQSAPFCVMHARMQPWLARGGACALLPPQLLLACRLCGVYAAGAPPPAPACPLQPAVGKFVWGRPGRLAGGRADCQQAHGGGAQAGVAHPLGCAQRTCHSCCSYVRCQPAQAQHRHAWARH